MAFQRHRLIAAAVAQGIDRSIIDRLDDLDVDGCQWLDEPGLRRYAQIVQENHLAARGVYVLHPVAQPKVSSRSAPRPAVTCATCKHMRRMPQTSPAGMQSCKAGHGMHYAHAEHVCDDWRPAISTVENREGQP